jgi:hypothetical protein
VAVALALLALAAYTIWLMPGVEAAAVRTVLPVKGQSGSSLHFALSAFDPSKLLLAALIGATVSTLQRYTRRGQPLPTYMAHTYVVLCIAGALMMTVIGDSVSRVIGAVGVAGVVRFGTPVDNPRDGLMPFVLMGLGMAAGIGAYGFAIAGTLFLAGCLFMMSRAAGEIDQAMCVSVIAEGAAFPASYVMRVFADLRIVAEPLEVVRGEQTVLRYKATLPGRRALLEASRQMVGHGITSVSWEAPQRWI